MLIANVADVWSRAVIGPIAFRAAPGPGEFSQIVPAGGATPAVYQPAFPIYIRRAETWIKDTDALVAAGGATTLTWIARTASATAGSLIAITNALTIANYNLTPSTTALVNGGGPTTPTGIAQLDCILFPAGFHVDHPNAQRVVTAICDVGSVTGVMYLAFEWRRLYPTASTP